MSKLAKYDDSGMAIKLGRIQVEFDALYLDKMESGKITQKDAVGALLSIASREGIPYGCFEYLERSLILRRASQAT